MSCRKVRRLLSPYLDEETTERERLMVGMHLSRCSECRRLFSQMRGMRLLLLATPRLPVAEEFARGWRARLREEKGVPSSSSRRPWFFVPALACLALLLACLVLIRPWSVPPALELGSLKRVPAPEGIAKPSPAPSTEGGGEAEPSPAAGAPSRDEKTAASPRKIALPPRASESEKALDLRKGNAAPPEASEALPAEEGTAKSVGAAADSPAEGMEDGSWRVWLLAVGPRPAELRRVLAEEGLLGPGQEAMALEVPLLLRQGLNHEEAQGLVERLESAGGRVRLEFVPR